MTIAVFGHGTAHALSAEGHTDWPGPGQLFLGTCYQPVDRSPEQFEGDVALMKQAGFKVVRMGDLSWDYFERAEGRFVRRPVAQHERSGVGAAASKRARTPTAGPARAVCRPAAAHRRR